MQPLIRNDKVPGSRCQMFNNATIKCTWASSTFTMHTFFFTTYCQKNTIFVSCLLENTSENVLTYWNYVTQSYQCGFQCNKSIIDHILCSCQILEKNWESAMGQYIRYLYTARKSMTQWGRNIYNTVFEFGLFKKIDLLIKICLKNLQWSPFW